VKTGVWRLLLALSAVLLIAQAPAGLLTDALASLCAGQCRFAEVEGYWWRGSADIYLGTNSGDRAWSRLGQVRWQPEGLGWQLTLGSGSARLAAEINGLHLAVDNIRFPAGGLLGQFGHGLPQDGWGGYLTARATELVMPWNFSPASGRGEIVWSQARTSLLENYPLGDYRLAWSMSADGGGRGHLSSDQGPLSVTGELTLHPFGFIGQADLAPAAGPLRKYLKLIGRPDGENRYRIALPAAPDAQ